MNQQPYPPQYPNQPYQNNPYPQQQQPQQPYQQQQQYQPYPQHPQQQYQQPYQNHPYQQQMQQQQQQKPRQRHMWLYDFFFMIAPRSYSRWVGNMGFGILLIVLSVVSIVQGNPFARLGIIGILVGLSSIFTCVAVFLIPKERRRI